MRVNKKEVKVIRKMMDLVMCMPDDFFDEDETLWEVYRDLETKIDKVKK